MRGRILKQTDGQTKGQSDGQTLSLRCDDASNNLYLLLTSFAQLKPTIFVVFYESVTKGRTDRRTDGRTDPHMTLRI